MSVDQQDTSPDGPQPSSTTPIAQQVDPTGLVADYGEIRVARPAADDNPMLLRSMDRSTAAKNILASMGVFLGMSIVAGMLAGRLLPQAPGEGEVPKGFLLLALPAGLITVAVIVWLLHSQRLPLSSIGMTFRNFGVEIAMGLPATVCSFGVFFGSIGLIYWFWPDGYRQLQQNPKNIDAMLPDVGPLVMLGIMACIAIYEEVLFRGVLLTHLRRLVNSWWLAVLIGAAVFSLLHASQQELATTIPLLLAGVVWSVFSIWRRSLAPAIVAHCMFNYSQVVYLFYEAPSGPLR